MKKLHGASTKYSTPFAPSIAFEYGLVDTILLISHPIVVFLIV